MSWHTVVVQQHIRCERGESQPTLLVRPSARPPSGTSFQLRRRSEREVGVCCSGARDEFVRWADLFSKFLVNVDRSDTRGAVDGDG